MTAVEWTLLITLFATAWLLALSPLLIPLFLALRGGPRVPRRWLFVVLAASAGYGFFGFLTALLWVPISFIGMMVVPQLQVDLPGAARILGPIIDRMFSVQSWFWLPVLVGFSIWFSLFFWKRWPRIAEVL